MYVWQAEPNYFVSWTFSRKWFGSKVCTKILSYISLKQIYKIFVYNIYIMIFIHFIYLFSHIFTEITDSWNNNKEMCNNVLLIVCFQSKKICLCQRSQNVKLKVKSTIYWSILTWTVGQDLQGNCLDLGKFHLKYHK